MKVMVAFYAQVFDEVPAEVLTFQGSEEQISKAINEKFQKFRSGALQIVQIPEEIVTYGETD